MVKQKLTFTQWMDQVDQCLCNMTGMFSECLPDWSYRADYDYGCTPQTSAKNAIRYAKEY